MNLLSIIGISTAYAADAAAPSPKASLIQMLPMLIGFFVIFYFLLIRPQNKRTKEHRDLISNLAKGDEIVTNGGILGKITKLSDNQIQIEIAKNVEITIQKNAVSSVLPKGSVKLKQQEK